MSKTAFRWSWTVGPVMRSDCRFRWWRGHGRPAASRRSPWVKADGRRSRVARLAPPVMPRGPPRSAARVPRRGGQPGGVEREPRPVVGGPALQAMSWVSPALQLTHSTMPRRPTHHCPRPGSPVGAGSADTHAGAAWMVHDRPRRSEPHPIDRAVDPPLVTRCPCPRLLWS